jgi:hypothetical protein
MFKSTPVHPMGETPPIKKVGQLLRQRRGLPKTIALQAQHCHLSIIPLKREVSFYKFGEKPQAEGAS